MLWLAILLPDLPLQVFTRGLRDVPAIAITADKPGAPLIAASASAQAAGIRPGQHATSASALLPELRLHARMPRREAEALNEISSWAGRFTPRVSLSSPDAVLLEIASCLRLFGSVHDITTQVASGLAALGFHARIGLAPTPLAARWFARCGRPAGEDWLQAIDQLPLSVLEDEAACDADTRALLAGLGLHSLGEARDLPAAGLARRGAQAVRHCLARARGEMPDPRPWFEAADTFSHGLELPAPTHHSEALLFAARRLLASLEGWLQARHAAIDHCQLILEHAHRPHSRLELVLGQPCRDTAGLLAILREQLARLVLEADVGALRLIADRPLAAIARTGVLFDDVGTLREQAVLLLDRLRARLGQSSVHLLASQPDHRPESAWRQGDASCAGSPAQHTCSAHATPLAREHKGLHVRPLWLLPEPRPIERADYVLLSEAERIECGWWDDHPVHRDYYLANNTGQALCWIFQALDPPGRWFLHGYFA